MQVLGNIETVSKNSKYLLIERLEGGPDNKESLSAN